MKRATARLQGFWLWPPVLLSAAGIYVSGYLVIKRFTGGSLVCSRWAQCDVVNNSIYSMIYGVPVSLIGLAGYLLLMVLALVAVWAPARTQRPLLVLSFVLALGGVGVSVYLTYLEIYVIEALCVWCVASAAIIALLALASGVNLVLSRPR